MIRTRLGAALAATALAGTALLTGCGGSSDEAAPAPASSAPASAPASASAAPASAASSAASKAEGRPSEKQVQAGLKKWMENNAGGQSMPSQSSKVMDKLFACWAQNLVKSDMSDEGLQQLVAGQNPSDMDDLSAMQQAVGDVECQKKATS